MSEMMGLEIHCQLDTSSKMFCPCSTENRNKRPNELTCPTCLGFPGSKPIVNQKAIDFGMFIALALNCKISQSIYFSRKTYFYPDLSKNYQITQYEEPLGKRGYLEIGEAKIRIREVHIEEDPAKMSYINGDITKSDGVLIDYNRSGMPLAEIVTEPDFTSTKQVRAFMEKLSSILEHLGVYDPSREASLRMDANISLDGGARVEVKNITGFENVEKALNFEIVRQRGLKRMEVNVERETRHFDSDAGNTKSLRKKEYEEDYGYIFDPDIPIIHISNDWVRKITDSMPELPDQRIQRIAVQYGIDEYFAKVLVYTDKHLADFFEECTRRYDKPKVIANWMINYLVKSLNWRSERIAQSKVRVGTFIELLQLMDSGSLTERYAKELIKEYVDTGTSPSELLKSQKVDITEDGLDKIVSDELSANKIAANEFKSGKAEALQFLIGNILKRTNRQGNPKIIREKIIEKLNMPR